jgi:hypothetical protein
MKGKSIVAGLLLAFVAVSVVYLVVTERDTRPAAEGTTEHPAAAQAPEENNVVTPAPDQRLVVYYFHGNKRCNTCRTIEAYTEEAIRTGFPDELRSGRLVWIPVNVDVPENGHFVEDFGLTTRTVVLVDVDQGNEEKWTKLDRVWQLVQNKEAFVDYITENTNVYLAKNNG